jgi:hypothetical protein
VGGAFCFPCVCPLPALSVALTLHCPRDLVRARLQNTTGQAGAVVDTGLLYTLRSLEAHRLAQRARRIHIVCPDGQGPPDYVKLHHPKIRSENASFALPF